MCIEGQHQGGMKKKSHKTGAATTGEPVLQLEKPAHRNTEPACSEPVLHKRGCVIVPGGTKPHGLTLVAAGMHGEKPASS